MPNNLLTLIAKRDFTKVANGGSIMHSVLKPISFELKTAQAVVIRIRRERMRELYEQDTQRERLAMKRLRMVVKANSCQFRCSPLGMLPAWH